MTTAVRPLPDHGTLSRAKYHRCHCDDCRNAATAYQRSRRRKRGYGTWQPLVDAEPVRQHLAMLREHGISYIRAAETAGLYPASVGRILYTVGGHAPAKRVRRETAAALLAVQPNAAEPYRCDATGTHRRIQALAANGWPYRRLAEHFGVHPSTPLRLLSQTTLCTSTAKTIADVYDRLQHQQPEAHDVTAWEANKARQRAAEQGWRDPLWWEDMGGIDDPAFDPAIADRALTDHEFKKVRRQEIIHLARFGLDAEEIQRRVGGDLTVRYVREVVNEVRTGHKRERRKPAAA